MIYNPNVVHVYIAVYRQETSVYLWKVNIIVWGYSGNSELD